METGDGKDGERNYEWVWIVVCGWVSFCCVCMNDEYTLGLVTLFWARLLWVEKKQQLVVGTFVHLIFMLPSVSMSKHLMSTLCAWLQPVNMVSVNDDRCVVFCQ